MVAKQNNGNTNYTELFSFFAMDGYKWFFENGKINDYFGSHIYDMLNFHWENVINVGGNNENSMSLQKHNLIYI